MDDHQLLEAYVKSGEETAFAKLVDRHLGLVYGAALRQVEDSALAADVAQAVFLLLARKAGSLSRRTVIVGWLFRTTRFVGQRARRAELRRQLREQEALAMQHLHSPDSPEDTWNRLAPELDEALASLGGTDRNAVLLRFGEGRSHREVGVALGLGEEAAKKRVIRALEKLRGYFAQRGLTLSLGVLTAGLSERLLATPPPELSAQIIQDVAGAGLAAPGPVAQLVHETIAAWRRTRIQIGAWVGVALIALVATVTLDAQRDANRSGGRVEVATSPTLGSTLAGNTTASVGTEPLNRGGFEVRVVAAESGEPIPSANVLVNTVVGRDWIRRDDLFTDERGVCVVPLPADSLGRLDVGVNVPGWASRFFTWRTDFEEPLPSSYTLRLRPAAPIGGVALDPQWQPIAGVDVWLLFNDSGDSSEREPPRERFGFVHEVKVATSDARGRWVCLQIPPGNSDFSLRFKHPDFVPAHLVGHTRDGDTALNALRSQTAETILQPGASAVGTITDPLGQPIARAKVSQTWFEEGETTQSDGAFVLRSLKPGPIQLLATAEGFAPKLFEVEAGGAPKTVQLEPGGAFRGRLLDEAGEPIAGGVFALELWAGGAQLDWSGVTDAEGRVEWLSAPVNQRLVFTAMARGFVSARDQPLLSDGKEHILRLRRIPVVSGTVIDSETRTAVASFKALPGSERSNWDRSELRRGTNGVYRLPFSEADWQWVRIEAEGYEIAEAEAKPVAPGELRADFALQRKRPGAGVRGIVLQPDGTPAVKTQVALCSVADGAVLGRGCFLPRSTPHLVTTDSAGRFEFPPIRAAHTVAAVSAGGFGQSRVRDGDLVVRLRPFGAIDGLLVRAGKPEANQEIVVMLPSPIGLFRTVSLDFESFRTRTDAEGRFRFEHVPAGDLNLYLHPGFGIPMTDRTPIIAVAGETIEVVMGEFLPGQKRLVGRLKASDPSVIRDWPKQVEMASLHRELPPPPVPAGLSEENAALWWLDWSESDEGRARARSGWSFALSVAKDGSFSVSGVPPGDYRLLVRLLAAEFIGQSARAFRYGGWIGEANAKVTVPEEEGVDADVRNLGEIVVQISRDESK